MNNVEGALGQAREADARRQRGRARAAYLSARAVAPLSAGDMAALGDAAWWEGAIDESLSACEEAYRLFLQGDDRRPRQAAMLAIDIGISWYLRARRRWVLGGSARRSGCSRASRSAWSTAICSRWRSTRRSPPATSTAPSRRPGRLPRSVLATRTRRCVRTRWSARASR